MVVLLTVLHVFLCIFLILVVLLQTGKRADLAGAFGGGGSQTAFGARGAATLLSKLTTAFAALFMVTSLALSIASSRGPEAGDTVLDEVPVSPAQSAPAQPAAPPAGDAPEPENSQLPASSPEQP